MIATKELNRLTPDMLLPLADSRPGGFYVEDGVALARIRKKEVAYTPEYKRGYLSAAQRAPVLAPMLRAAEKNRPGRTGFVEGWRDYFKEHH